VGWWQLPDSAQGVARRWQSGGLMIGLATATRWIGGAQVAPGWRRQGRASATGKRERDSGDKVGCPRRARGDGLAAARRQIGGAQAAAGWRRAGEVSAAGK